MSAVNEVCSVDVANVSAALSVNRSPAAGLHFTAADPPRRTSSSPRQPYETARASSPQLVISCKHLDNDDDNDADGDEENDDSDCSGDDNPRVSMTLGSNLDHR